MKFNDALRKYCRDVFQSEEYADKLVEYIYKGVITPVNMENFLEPNLYVCCKDVSVLKLLRNPYSFSIPLDSSVFPMERHLADLSIFINHLRTLNTGDINIADFSVYLYILWVTTNPNYADLLLTQFIRSLVDNKPSNVTLVLYDYPGLCNQVLLWNESEYKNRFRRSPLYAEITLDKVAKFLGVITKALGTNSSVRKGFAFPKIKFMYTQVNNLEGMLYARLFTEDVTQNNEEHLKVFRILQSRDDDKISEYLRSRKDEDDKIYELYKLFNSVKKGLSKEIKWSDAALSEWSRYCMATHNAESKEPYNPFTADYKIRQPFSEVIIDYLKFKEYIGEDTPVVDYKMLFREVYLAAQSINDMRRKYVQVEDSDIYPLTVTIENMVKLEEEHAMYFIDSANESIDSLYMDEHLYRIGSYTPIKSKRKGNKVRKHTENYLKAKKDY